jgi:hypothetical protein
MGRLLTIVLLSGVLVAVPAGAALAKPERVEVCHLDKLGEWKPLSVPAVGRAVYAHLRHGDALPGETVPGMKGYTFDESCTPVLDELPETVFAVAYTDVDPFDGEGYNAVVDVLIAKLIDGPGAAGDGSIGAGDLVITNRYPLVLDGPFTYGYFNVRTHTITSVRLVGAETIWVSDEGANFFWRKRPDTESYLEHFSGFAGAGVMSVGDGLRDVIIAQPPGPSEAETAVDVRDANLERVGDDAFIDVEFNLP